MLDFLLDSAYWDALLTPEAKASLTEKLIIVAVIWVTMGRKVSNKFQSVETKVGEFQKKFYAHLDAIEEKFEKMVDVVQEMKETFSKDLKVNSEALRVNSIRLERVEDAQEAIGEVIKEVKFRVEKLEQP